jgi:hypothetical protein
MKILLTFFVLFFIYGCDETNKNTHPLELFEIELLNNLKEYLPNQDYLKILPKINKNEFVNLPLELLQDMPLIGGKEYYRTFDIYVDENYNIAGIYAYRDPARLNKLSYIDNNNCFLQKQATINRVSVNHNLNKEDYIKKYYSTKHGYIDAYILEYTVEDRNYISMISCYYTPNISSYKDAEDNDFDALLMYSISTKENFEFLGLNEISTFNSDLIINF